MKVAQVKLTSQQKNKLKKGQSIRVNPNQVNGAGVMLVINPNKYNALTKAFDSNRGMMFQLDDDELEANMNPEMIDDDEVVEVMEGQGLMAGGGRKWKNLTKEEKKHKKKKRRRREKASNPFIQASRKASEAGREIHKVGYDIEAKAQDVGKEMKGISKAVLGKRATRALLDMGYELKDVAMEVGEDLIKEVEAMGDEVLGEFLEEFEDLTKEAKDTIRKLDKASKIISRNITPDKWGNLVKEIPRFYRAELRDTIVGEMLREAIRKGSKTLIESAIKAMYTNPYTAPLAPAADMAYQLYGEQAIEELVKVSGAGLYARGDGLSAGGGLKIPNSPEKIRKMIDRLKKRLKSVPKTAFSIEIIQPIKDKIATLKKALDRMTGEGLSAGGGLRAGGNGLMAGGQAQSVSLQTRAPIPNFLLKKQLMLPVDASEGEGLYAGRGSCPGMMVGSGGGAVIMGLDEPVKAGVVRPRPLFATTLLNKSI